MIRMHHFTPRAEDPLGVVAALVPRVNTCWHAKKASHMALIHTCVSMQAYHSMKVKRLSISQSTAPFINAKVYVPWQAPMKATPFWQMIWSIMLRYADRVFFLRRLSLGSYPFQCTIEHVSTHHSRRETCFNFKTTYPE